MSLGKLRPLNGSKRRINLLVSIHGGSAPEPPQPGDALLMETGDFLLLENGDLILLEA